MLEQNLEKKLEQKQDVDSAKRCTYFYSAYLLKGILANSGLNCNHPEQQEVTMEEGQAIGNCYSWSCPLRKEY